MNYELANYLESIGAKYNHRGCPEDPNGEWLLYFKKPDVVLHIPKEAIEGGYFKGKMTNPMTLENLKESIEKINNS